MCLWFVSVNYCQVGREKVEWDPRIPCNKHEGHGFLTHVLPYRNTRKSRSTFGIRKCRVNAPRSHLVGAG